MEAVLEFLRKNGFVEAESALREDITERQNLGLLGCDGLPRLPLVRIVLGNQSSANLNDSDDSSSSIDSAAFMSSGSYDNLGLGSDFSPSGLCKSEGSFDTLSEFGTARDSEINNPCLLWDSDTYFYNENHKQAMPLDTCFGAQDITNCLSEDKFVTTLEVEGACKDRQEQFQQLTSLYLNSSELPITSSTNHIETNLEKQLCFPMSNTSIDHAKDHEDLEIFEMIRENEGCQYRGLKTLPEHGRCEDFTEGYSCSPTCCDCCDKLSGFYGEESGALDYDCHARGQAKDSIFSLCGCNGLGFDDQNSFKEGKLTNFELKHEEGNPTSIAWEKDMMQCSRHSENSAGNWQKVSAVLPKMELPRRSDTNRDYASDDKDRGASMNSLVTSSETDVKGYDFSRDSCLHVGIAELPSEADGNDVDELDGREMISVRHDPYTINDEEEHCINNELHMLENHEDEYEIFDLRIIHRKNRTGFEENKDLPIVLNTIIAGRYYVTEYLGSAAFSRVIQAHDLQTGMDVCMKIIKNDKDYFDQSLDEIKLLKFVNKHDPADKYHVLRLYDYFYHQEHLFIVCELLRANLYEFQKFNQDSGGEVYFTLSRLQAITRQCLEALEFLHHLGIIHCDLKPENILIKSYSRCEVKVIDLGSSCFQTDNICLYVQSRSYRAPEVILGLPYDQKIDVWSLGCILVELYTGDVLFPNDSLVMMLARMIGMLGAIDMEMLLTGQETSKYFTNNYDLYHTNEETGQLEYIIPKKSSLARHLGVADVLFIGFIRDLLQINPQRRPTAREALEHPWLFCQYE